MERRTTRRAKGCRLALCAQKGEREKVSEKGISSSHHRVLWLGANVNNEGHAVPKFRVLRVRNAMLCQATGPPREQCVAGRRNLLWGAKKVSCSDRANEFFMPPRNNCGTYQVHKILLHLLISYLEEPTRRPPSHKMVGLMRRRWHCNMSRMLSGSSI